MTRVEADAQLHALIGDDAKHRFRRDSIHQLVAWYAIGGLSDAEVVARANDLAKAAKAYFKELERCEPFWRYMAFAAPSGKFKFGSAANAVEFSADAPWLPRIADVLRDARVVELAAKTTARNLAKTTRAADPYRKGLGISLANIFNQITGSVPGFSGAASGDNPRSRFGRFVDLSLRSSPESDSPRIIQLLAALPSFVRDAAQAFKGFNRDGTETPSGDEPGK